VAHRLADETSPYLRQHVDNPVDWWPWCTEAFEEARRRDVPVLVSIGYSACHWCHVMAHESFEDPAMATVVNRLFVAVKVDREERPDVDAIYMDAVQAMQGHGGWPMTVFCLPDGRPFFAGTYFPPVTRGNHLGFGELCERIGELWVTRRADLEQQAEAITDAIATGSTLPDPSGDRRTERLDEAAHALLERVDRIDGGFGGAPKFPQTFAIDTLLRHHLRTGAPDSLAAALLCLDAMAAGGIFDHLGGGFARYATDRRWLVPHFEKMLYDQALLIRVYVHAWQITGEDRYAQVVRESIAYVLRDLRDPAGGFHSAEDADSEGVEGRFYVWTLDEVVDVCGDDADAVIEWFGITAAGNWEGVMILERPVRDDLIRPPAVTRGCAALFATRATRVRPGLDDKVLTEWNALMISTLAEAGAALGEPTWIEVAVEAGLFLLEELRVDGRWMRTWQGRAHIPAFSADHAALVDAFVRLHEATGDPRWIDEAIVTADTLLDLFADPAEPGVFTSGVDAERLIARPKEFMDNATACANSLAAVALLRLSALTGDERHCDAARAIVDHTLDAAVRIPLGFGHLLLAAELDLLGTTEIVVTGDRPELLAEVRRRYLPGAVVSWGGPIAGPLWEGRDERGAEGRAHVCRNMVCALPATTVDELRRRLDALD